jgi:hypothetical protein
MLIPLPAIALGVLGVLIWGVTIERGPTCAFGDAEAQRRLWIFAGAACFALAGLLLVLGAVS